MDHTKRRKWIALGLAGIVVLTGLGILTGSFERIINAGKAFIYCNGDTLPDKSTQFK